MQSDAAHSLTRLLATHKFQLAHGSIDVSRERVTVGADHVPGPVIPTAHALRELADQLRLDLGQTISRLGATERAWPAEGTAQVRSLRAVVIEHVLFLFDRGGFRDDLGHAVTLHLKLAADFGHTGRFTIMGTPFYADLVSILPDPEIFRAGIDAAVSEPLIWLLAAEKDAMQPLSALAAQRVQAMLDLAAPVLLRDDANAVAHVVTFQVSASCFP